MLCFRRFEQESIIIDGCIEVKILKVIPFRTDKNKAKVEIGIEAPKDISVHRKEVQEAINREKELVMPVALG